MNSNQKVALLAGILGLAGMGSNEINKPSKAERKSLRTPKDRKTKARRKSNKLAAQSRKANR